MKKILLISAAAAMIAASASAQNLSSLLGSIAGNTSASDVLNTVSKAVYAYTGNTNAVDLPGTWVYDGSAVSLGSESTLSNIAGAAASTTVENKVDEYLQKIGVKSGTFVFVFKEDLTFSCTAYNVPLEGTWKMTDDGTKIQLQFGKMMKYLSMTGTLAPTLGGCQMLFNGTKFLSFLKSALTYINKATGKGEVVNSLAGSYSSVQIGMTLTRQKS